MCLLFVQMFGWLGSFCCSDAWVHHVRVSRGHLVLFSSAGGWPGRLMPDDWIGLWCGFASYSGTTLSSGRQMCRTVCTCGPPPHLVPPNPATHKCTHLYGHVCLIKCRKNPLYFTDMHLNRNYCTSSLIIHMVHLYHKWMFLNASVYFYTQIIFWSPKSN